VAALLARLRLQGARYAIVGPGASYGPAKRWAPERFGALGRILAARGLGVLACGSDAEREICERVAAEVGAGALSLAGETDLGLQAGLCERAAVAVCNDSGLAHLSASTGAPTVVIFGSTSSAWTAPRGPRVRVVQRAPVCAPCFRRTCRIGYRCLDAIGVEAAWRACVEAGAAT
jgi:heptosyltransferase-2